MLRLRSEVNNSQRLDWELKKWLTASGIISDVSSTNVLDKWYRYRYLDSYVDKQVKICRYVVWANLCKSRMSPESDKWSETEADLGTNPHHLIAAYQLSSLAATAWNERGPAVCSHLAAGGAAASPDYVPNHVTSCRVLHCTVGILITNEFTF